MDYRDHRPDAVARAVVERFRATIGRPVAATEEAVIAAWACEAYASAAMLDAVLKGVANISLNDDGKPVLTLADR